MDFKLRIESLLLVLGLTGCGSGVNLVTVTSISPSSGYHLGQIPVTITGTKFYGNVSVQVSGANCNGVTLVSSTQLTCTLDRVTNTGSGDVTVTSSWAGTGSLTSAYAAFRTVYVTNTTSNTVAAFRMNPLTGVVTSAGTAATGSVPASVVVDASGKYTLVSNNSGASISVYAINTTTGALTAVSGSPFTTTATNPMSMLPLAINKVLVAGTTPSSIDVYTLNPDTGALTAASGGVATANSPRLMGRNASGTFAFLHITGSNLLNAYSISQTTGALTLTDSTAAAGIAVAVDPRTRFVYAPDISGNVNAFTFNTSTGLFASAGTGVSPNGSRYTAIHPDSTFLYSLSLATPTVDVFSINSGTGALTYQLSSAITGGSGGGYIEIDPSGSFLLAIDSTAAELVVLSINPNTGALTMVSRTPITGINNNSAIGISGTYL